MSVEATILGGLINNEEYTRKVIPFLKDDYFTDSTEAEVFRMIAGHIVKYNGLPTKDALRISAEKNYDLSEDVIMAVDGLIGSLAYDQDTDTQWLVDETETFCQDKAIYNAVKRSIRVLDGRDENHERGAIPELLSTALGVSFDANIGHDFLGQFDERFDFYHKIESRVPFDLEFFNKITRGGLPDKSLSVILAGTGVGKTLAMTHMAAANMMLGKNVLYITNEMAEERIAERIDANLLDVPIDDLLQMTKETYAGRMHNLKKRTKGKLVIKEYPTASAGAAHYRHLLNELRLKSKFVPDIIYIDYLNIAVSSRMKMGSNVNSYTYIKAIAEEFRGLAVEFGIPIVTATQTNRSGFTSSDPGLEDTSESFGLPATADFMIALVTSEELEALGQLMVKQLKNRWGDISSPKRFVVGVNRAKMKLYDVEQSAQNGINGDEDKSVMDSSDFGERLEEERQGAFGKRKSKFGGFK